MSKFIFHMGVNVRAYGDVAVEAATIEDAVKMLTPDFVGANVEPAETTWDNPGGLTIIDAKEDSDALYENAARAAGWSIGKAPNGDDAFIAGDGREWPISAADPGDWRDLCRRENIVAEIDLSEWSQFDLPSEYDPPSADALAAIPADTVRAAELAFPASDWRYDVANRDTMLGYREWLAHQIEAGGLDQLAAAEADNSGRAADAAGF